MGCNCKNSSEELNKGPLNEGSESVGVNIVKYTLKIIGFLIGMLLLPIIMLAVIWFMFDTIVLNKAIDMRLIIEGIVKVNKKFVTSEDDEDDEEIDNELTENDVVMLNLEEIIVSK